MNKFLSFIVFFTLFTGVNAQQVSPSSNALLSGSIFDFASKKPVDQATIFIYKRSVSLTSSGHPLLHPLEESSLVKTAKSNAEGYFSIPIKMNTGKGYYYIKVMAPHQEPYIKTLLELKPSQHKKVEIQLIPSNPGQAMVQQMVQLKEISNTQKDLNKIMDYQNIEMEMAKAIDNKPLSPQNNGMGVMACDYQVPEYVFVDNLQNGYNGSGNGNGFTGYIDFNEYIAGVTEGELSITSILQAKMAQAVAARTHSVKRHELGLAVNLGQAHDDSPSNSSIQASYNTSRQVVTKNGSIISAKYSARCNGDYTQGANEGIWNPYNNCNASGNVISYLVSRPCTGHINCSATSEMPCCEVISGSPADTVYIFGHGVGLCQRGILAWGLPYDEMLHKYYTGVCIANQNTPNDNSLNCFYNAMPLSQGILYPVQATLNAISHENQYACQPSWNEIGPERIHSYTPTWDGELTATISGFSGNLDVFITEACDGDSCLAYGESSATFVNAKAGQEYYIIVDSRDGSGSGYNIKIDYLITDSINCNNFFGISSALFIDSAFSSPESMQGVMDGSVSAYYSGGTPPYVVSLSDGTNTYTDTTYLLQHHFTNIPKGIYNLEITDEAGCFDFWGIEVEMGDCYFFDTTGFLINHESYPGQGDGSLHVEVVYGYSPFEYLYVFNGMDSSTTNSNDSVIDLTNLLSGNYTMYITDGMNCVKGFSFAINPGNPTGILDCSNADTLLCGVSHHQIESQAPNFVQHYTCQPWGEEGPERVHLYRPEVDGPFTIRLSNYSPGADLDVFILSDCSPDSCISTTHQDTAYFSSGVAGQVYYVVVDSDNGSTSAYDIVVECMDSNLTACNLNLQITEHNQSTTGALDGWAGCIVSGGTPPYNYLWSNMDTLSYTDGLDESIYQLVVTDSLGCTDSITANIGTDSVIPCVLNLQLSSINESTLGAGDGSASVIALSGTSPYTYNWSNGSTGPILTHLQAGNYTVTATDNTGCSGTGLVNINSGTNQNNNCQNLTLHTHFQNASSHSNTDGWAKAWASGGLAPYQYTWTIGNFSSSADSIYGLSSGTYHLSVKDMNNCLDSAQITIGVLSTNALYEAVNYRAGVFIYPNPAQDKLTIKNTNKENTITHINLYGALGNKIATKPFGLSNTNELLLENLPRGLYLIELVGEKSNSIEKIVLE